MEQYRAAEVVWCQEEPKNMGAWRYVKPRFDTAMCELVPDDNEGHDLPNRELRYVGRTSAASPGLPLPQKCSLTMFSCITFFVREDLVAGQCTCFHYIVRAVGNILSGLASDLKAVSTDLSGHTALPSKPISTYSESLPTSYAFAFCTRAAHYQLMVECWECCLCLRAQCVQMRSNGIYGYPPG